ncbi:MLP-like protein 28 [Humulus lupulus]|uniref:MLP-like protein 28 n=1 Tax=Humulus lupulus TaxID=3486 RepID=UPI002B410F69|nr:MLP-like protein 28 [Humulus lupulus]
MAQIAKLEVQLEIKSSAEKFFEIFSCKQHLIPKMCPEIIKDIKVIKGDWKSVGSIKEWSYIAGSAETSKEMVEEIDEKNKSITFKIIDGEMTKYYKNVKSTIHATENIGQKLGSSVKWTLQYEKMNDNIPDPTKYAELISVFIKTADAYLIKNA